VIAKSSPRKRTGLPFVFVNVAISADGKIASANRAVGSVSSKLDREHMMVLRAQADAVMSGARTVDLNPVTLGPGSEKYRKMRLQRGFTEYNLRIVVSGSGTLDPKAEIFKRHFSPIIILGSEQMPQRRLQLLQTVADEVKLFGADEIDFAAAFRWLKDKWKVKRLLCEGGGEVNGALFRADLVDEIHLTICPKIVGGRNAPTLADGENVLNLAAAKEFQIISAKRVGDEMFLIYRRSKM
jgi:2,5-diamino-6-(ribosylamino)-4(3H)-pyrimidinone 5'-phosphate reductase